MSVFIVVGHSIFIVVQYLSLNFQTMMVVGPTTIDNTNNDTNNDMITVVGIVRLSFPWNFNQSSQTSPCLEGY